ncbi:MAG: sigma-54-dependent Fis family transcriptional regulator [Fibrobacteres bacterium]|nr:sigma-54-dependent Fis family transcriptional regulator [Fibrobacterota bacterium]
MNLIDLEQTLFYDSLSDSIVLLIDNDGVIVASELSVDLTSLPDFLRSAMRVIHKSTDIRTLFDIPHEFSFSELPVEDSIRNLDSRTFKSRQSAFTSVSEEEGFFSDIPIFFIQIYKLPSGQCLGRMRQSNFYKSITEDNVFNGYVCVDSTERIVAYNSAYLRYTLTDSQVNPHAIMGRELRDYISPTPSETQEIARRAFSFPQPETIRDVVVENWPEGRKFKADEQLPLFHYVSNMVDWEKDDLCMEVDLVDGDLPCIVLGDLRVSTGEVSDLDGYLIGTSPDKGSVLLKKRSRKAHSVKFKPATIRGRYRFWRVGNQFVVDKDGTVLLFFLDYDMIDRKKTDVSLFFRPGTYCRISAIRLSTFDSHKIYATNNSFVTAKSNTGSFFLLSLAHIFLRSGTNDNVSIYRLQNMANVKERLVALESSYKDAVEKAKAADNRLKAFMEDESQFVGSSKSFTVIKEQAEKVASSKATILIQGNTGSGKEVLAKHIHSRSSFSKGPFVKVDCSTLPKSLMESLLFGHEKGAFTGASEKRKGLFEQAEGGTLYLDEASNLELQVQAKLLQFLQDMTVTPVGGKSAIKLNLRIIVATNVQLLDLVKQGLFREDLYYRIAVVVLKLPSLAERMEDVQSLASHFVHMFNFKYGRDISGFSVGASRKLSMHNWPGNVRELRHTIERAFLFGASGEIREEDIVFTKGSDDSAQGRQKTGTGVRKELERITATTQEVMQLFGKHNGVIRRIADDLNVTRQTLYNFLKKNNINVNTIRNK